MLFCQDKEIGVGAMERKRIEYIDWLRIISAITLLVDSMLRIMAERKKQ